MIFSLDVRRARKGDCLLLHFGTKKAPGLIMIDGGPSDVFAPQLRPRLLKIKDARRLGQGTPLPVDVLMVSHVDDDHIKGILDLTRELIATPENARPVRVSTLWHNTFDDIIGNTPKELTAALTAQFGAASLAGGLPDTATIELDDAGAEDPEVAEATLQVLASIEQGHRLRDDAVQLEIDLNSEFGGKLIVASKEAIDMGGGLTLTVAGPMKPELRQLQKKHDAWLKTLRKKPKPAAALAAYVDKSVPNLSSLVVLAKAGGKSMLLTGDARGDKILAGLETIGALKAGKSMHVDVLKVPHHGSSNNLTRSFFARITADHYVFSGNGEQGNPEREAFEMLFKARGSAPFAIHLTYGIAQIDQLRKADWKTEQTEEKARKAAGGKKEPRANWSPATQSLGTFFAPGRLAAGQELRIVGKSAPHVIDLLDPLGF